MVDHQALLEAMAEVRARLNLDGGDIELVAVEGTIVRVRMLGACVGCSLLDFHLKETVEAVIRQRVPIVTAVVNIF